MTEIGHRSIRVLVAEDEEQLRIAICDLIAGEDGLEVVAAVADAEDAIGYARALRPDVALLDMRMPSGGGARAAREIALASPETRCLGLSAYDDRATVLEMLQAGAVGYLIKGDSPDEILEAIRRSSRDQSSLPRSIVAELVDDCVGDSDERGVASDVARASETRFERLLESAPDAVVVIDSEGVIVLVNEQTERLFGYQREELIGQAIEALLPARLRDRHVGLRGGYFTYPSTRPMGAGLELAGLRKDGSEFPVEISLSAIETPDGLLATALIRDVTEAKAAELTRRRTEAWFETVLESAPDAVVIADANGQIVLVNTQTETLFGYSRSELLGEAVEVLLPERFHEHHVGHRDGHHADPRARPMGTRLELSARRKDGSEFAVDISLSGIETGQGHLVAAFVRDVTGREARLELDRAIGERRAVLAHLVSAGEEERRRIAADIHDDSIQVMTAAGMRLQILRKAITDPEQLTRLAELEQTIQHSIARLRHLIFELRPPALDDEGLAAALHAYLSGADETSGTSYRLNDRLVAEPAEDIRVILYRIAQEVFTNIRKHAGAQNVAVALETHEHGYRVRIADDGVGFAPGAAPALPGHLGLAAIRERAELAGGWLRIESAPGEGTVVEFWIPMQATASDGLHRESD